MVCHDLGMDAQTREELRILRIRAYGPSPDIHEDRIALQRLEELEALSRPFPASSPTAVAASTAMASPLVVGAERGTGEPHDAQERERAQASPANPGESEPVPSTAATPQTPAGRWRAIRPTLICAGALVLAVALAVALTSAIVSTPVVARDLDARQVATLRPDPAFEMPAIFASGPDLGQNSTGFEDFFGMTAMQGSGLQWAGVVDSDCLILIRTSDAQAEADSFSGRMYTSCSAGAFPATVEMVVDDQLPQEFRDEFPDGTALQFVLVDSRVGVFIDAD